jgi:hypothetical protein
MARPHRRVGRLAGGTVLAAFMGLAVAAFPGTVLPGSSPEVLAAPAGLAGDGQAQAGPAKKDPPVKPAKDPVAKLAMPWPSAEELAARREEAENLPLFKTASPLPVTITADFTAINKDRKPDSDKRFPGVVQLQADGGQTASLPVTLSTRGHARLNARTCEVVPLRLDFAKQDVTGTVFEGQGELKLVTHCRNDRDHDQVILTEYLAYQVFRLFTPRSFRARLVQATYVDSAKKKTSGPRYAMLLEEDGDVARRMEGRIFPLTKRHFRQLDQDSLTLMTLLEFLIGNTDYSIYALHNVRLVQEPRGTIYTVAYDFDYSGLVNAEYAVADRRLFLTSVRDRLYRGPCRTAEELEPFLATFRARKSEVLGLVDTIPDFKPVARDQARDYLNDFFSLIEPKRVKRNLIDPCVKAGM